MKKELVLKYKTIIIEALILLMVFSLLSGLSGGSDPRSTTPWLFSYSSILSLATIVYLNDQETAGKLKTLMVVFIAFPLVLTMVSAIGFVCGIRFGVFLGIYLKNNLAFCSFPFVVLLLIQSVILVIYKRVKKMYACAILVVFTGSIVAVLQFSIDFLDFQIWKFSWLPISILVLSAILIILYLLPKHCRAPRELLWKTENKQPQNQSSNNNIYNSSK